MDANKNMNIFRLIHFDNLEDTLRNGMYSRNRGHIVPNFVNIGDTTLIKQRETFTVPVNPPNGNLGDYIPFYFAGHSPMLLNIKTGADQENRAKEIMLNAGLELPIYIDTKRKYFYP